MGRANGGVNVSFLRQAGITLVVRGFLLVITFTYNILLARKLQAEGIGTVGTLQTFANVAVQFGNLGLAVGAVYFIGLDKTRSKAIAGTLFTLGLLISLILFVGFTLAGIIAPTMLGGISFPLYIVMLLSVAPLLLSLFFQQILLVHQEITAYNLIELGVRAVSLVAAFVIMFTMDDDSWIPAIVWLTVASGVAMGLFNGLYAWKSSPFKLGIDWKAFRDMASYGWKSYYATLMGFLIIRSDIIFINAYIDSHAAGVYRQVVYVSDLVYLIPITIGTLLFPRLMQAGESDDTGPDKRSEFTMLVARIISFLLQLFWILFAIIGVWFLGIFGPEFTVGYGPLMILLGGIFFLGVESILAAELARRGLPIFVVVYSTVVVIFKIVANIILIPRYGAFGAAWSSFGTHFIFLAMVLWYCCRHYGFSVDKTLFIRHSDFQLLKERLKAALHGE